MKYLLILLFVLFSTASANTAEFYSQYDDIFKKYEKEYGVPFFLVKAIAITENNDMDKNSVSKNTDGTRDIGLMQINTSWIKNLPEEKLSVEKLKKPEHNIRVAFIILDDLIKKYGYNWESIGKYHSSTPKYKKIWLSRIKGNIQHLASIDKRIVITKKRESLD